MLYGKPYSLLDLTSPAPILLFGPGNDKHFVAQPRAEVNQAHTPWYPRTKAMTLLTKSGATNHHLACVPMCCRPAERKRGYLSFLWGAEGTHEDDLSLSVRPSQPHATPLPMPRSRDQEEGPSQQKKKEEAGRRGKYTVRSRGKRAGAEIGQCIYSTIGRARGPIAFIFFFKRRVP